MLNKSSHCAGGLPDFVIIGGSKCGTHWINECLREHRDIFLTRDVHEIFFFDRYFERGVDWYARYFSQRTHQKRVGDITPTYLAHPASAARIKKVLPNATLLVSLRNPLQRAWSKYLHMWRKGDIPSGLGFRDACEAAPEIIDDGRYAAHLERWLEYFPRSQLHLLVLDDARDDPAGFLRRIYEILEVDPAFEAQLTRDRTNEHQTPRSLVLAKWAFRFSRFLHRSRLHGAVELCKRLGLKRLVLQSGRDARKDPPGLSPEEREWLVGEYEADVNRLSELVGRDLDQLWLAAERQPAPAAAGTA